MLMLPGVRCLHDLLQLLLVQLLLPRLLQAAEYHSQLLLQPLQLTQQQRSATHSLVRAAAGLLVLG
jgi:hypothetical protein